jgi:ADP-ribose pyrophosphatase YjhB (NUDIX family)
MTVPPPRQAADAPHHAIPSAIAGHLRVRVAALLFDTPERPDEILLVEHAGLWDEKPFWSPPGGGVAYGESLPEALQREVMEETGVDIEVGPLRYVLDFVRPPLHAVSFYFEARPRGAVHLGTARIGSDPELSANDQILRSLRMVPLDDLAHLTLYPEPFTRCLACDARAGFPDGTAFLGTFR